ncbi:alpha amylase C-terminal domain-containing protein [Sphingomonas bacterium]|uniref:alpha amylase C-terminal domain-containing protein n=1 Tax=Sphingomonas bacterium TaxID=1895847 RepID=UPI0015768F2A
MSTRSVLPAVPFIPVPSLPAERSDAEYRAHRASVDPRRMPISIYQVHPGSWDRAADGGTLDWDQLAERLIPYAANLGFTHIGLMATDGDDDEEGLVRLVDTAHHAGLGVLIDWTAANATVEVHDLGKRETVNLLVDDALRWTGRVDGLHIGAVAAMLYRDYGAGTTWDAVEFLRTLHRALAAERPGVFTIADETTAWPGVTLPADQGGLGFGFKSNLGWAHDTLQYFARDPAERGRHHREITFGIGYAFAGTFILPLGHDEVVGGRGSLLARMAGDDWAQLANLRALYGLMWGHPGKKLLFMGQEFAQRRAWSNTRALDWHLRSSGAHEGVRNLVRDLNRLYRERPALHASDGEIDGFEWLVADDTGSCVFAWLRRTPGAAPFAVIANLSPVARAPYRLPLPAAGWWREIFNSDAEEYRGTGLGNGGGVEAANGAAWVTLPPLATIMLEHQG